MKKEYINIPNALSLSRLVFLPLLFVFVIYDMRMPFFIGYMILGATDMFDGWVARTFNMKTEFGKAMDSIADIPFYLASAWFLYKLFPEFLAPNAPLLRVFFVLFALSFVVSGILCKKPIMMHTFLLKLNGILVYFLILISHFTDTTLLVTFILIIYLVGFVEEIIIFIKYGEVDPDTPTVFALMKKDDGLKPAV